MGIDAGFDMVPRLSKGVVDRNNWDAFINSIKSCYKDDNQVEIRPDYILFKTGEHPCIPFEGHKFLRFSSKVSGATAASSGVEDYIHNVTRIAKLFFGSRVQYWHEGFQGGHYSWKEVNESIRSYEQQDEPDTHTSIASFLFGTDHVGELGIPLFEIKDIPGKGKGLIARFNIAKGTQILCEEPLLAAQSMSLGVSQLELSLAAKLSALPKASQRQFLSLHNNSPGKFPFSNIFKTNALPCGPGSSTGGVYPTICLINHSCIPNSMHSWDERAEHETIYADRPILAGEEITISYIDAGTYAVRRASLKESFGFDCNCCGCSRSPAELQVSDARRLRMEELDKAIVDVTCMTKRPRESLRYCRSLLRVMEAEFDGYAPEALNARLYYDAFQISIGHGDQARASVFAERAYKARVSCEGEDSPEAQRMKSFALNPVAHECFGLFSMQWKTTRKMVPKGLDTMQFEEWLFRVK